MNLPFETTPERRAAVNGLAVVGFVTLIGLGMWLAVYSARFVPAAVGRLGAAAVALTQIFIPNPAPSLSVVPTASTTIPFTDTGATTSAPALPEATSTPHSPSAPIAPTPGPKTTGAYQIGGTGAPSLSGLPDLTVTVTAVGYLATSSADSFVSATTVPHGARPAVSFVIKNDGTNASGSWRFSASIPTQTAYIYQSLPQQSLNPGDSIAYTLGFDQANAGSNQTISITANFDHAVAESNANNDSASAKLTILGS